MSNLIYTGIGSRETPDATLAIMYNHACILSMKGCTLRSGHADGADIAFENGCLDATQKMEIYIPWKGFNNAPDTSHYIIPEFTQELFNIASKFHPAWDKCSYGVKKLHMRNVCQILGQDLNTPSDFVICYTHNGSGKGGTGQAIRIAKAYNIPVFDLGFGEREIIRLNNFIIWRVSNVTTSF